jgi:hypothetical protein
MRQNITGRMSAKEGGDPMAFAITYSLPGPSAESIDCIERVNGKWQTILGGRERLEQMRQEIDQAAGWNSDLGRKAHVAGQLHLELLALTIDHSEEAVKVLERLYTVDRASAVNKGIEGLERAKEEVKAALVGIGFDGGIDEHGHPSIRKEFVNAHPSVIAAFRSLETARNFDIRDQRSVLVKAADDAQKKLAKAKATAMAAIA